MSNPNLLNWLLNNQPQDELCEKYSIRKGDKEEEDT